MTTEAIGYLVPVYQEVTILFSLTRWMETVLVRKCFMRYSNFAHKLNSQLWMETQLLYAFESFLKYWIVIIQVLLHPSEGITNFLDQYSKVKIVITP